MFLQILEDLGSTWIRLPHLQLLPQGKLKLPSQLPATLALRLRRLGQVTVEARQLEHEYPLKVYSLE